MQDEENIKLILSGLNNTKKFAFAQAIDSMLIKSEVILYKCLPDSLQEIIRISTDKHIIELDIPVIPKADYIVNITSDIFKTVCIKFNTGSAKNSTIEKEIHQYDKESINTYSFDNKRHTITSFLLVNGWEKTETGWKSKYGTNIEDTEKAFFFQEYLNSQNDLNIEELKVIKLKNPTVWEKFCWETFQKKTQKQWNEFVTEHIMEELDAF